MLRRIVPENTDAPEGSESAQQGPTTAFAASAAHESESVHGDRLLQMLADLKRRLEAPPRIPTPLACPHCRALELADDADPTAHDPLDLCEPCKRLHADAEWYAAGDYDCAAHGNYGIESHGRYA